jgi:hypothetical protein
MLYRAAGSPLYDTEEGFSDVSEEMYYYDAVMWAKSHGIAQGAGDGTFLPEATLNREQAFTFVYRAF